MEEMEIQKENFTGERPGYDPDNIGMAEVICCVRLMKKVEKPVAPPLVEQIRTKTFVVPEPEPPPPPPPEAKPATIVRYFTHNELMERFRCAHPMPIPELYTTLWPQPLAMPFPEHPASKVWSVSTVPVINRYLVGDMA
jgi:hypothetical protein